VEHQPEGSRSDRTGERFLTDASLSLRDVAALELPENLEIDDRVRLAVRRLFEASAEQCDAISVLQAESLHRPAHAVLRMLLESIAHVVWLAADPVKHAGQLWEQRLPPFRNLLEQIGWEAEYELSYGWLSEFIHPSEGRLSMYRAVDSGPEGLFPEIAPNGELYLLPEVDGVPYVSFVAMTSEEAETLYGPFVRAKALDLVLSGLWELFGSDAMQMDWWPANSVDEYEEIVLSDPALAGLLQSRFLDPN
jgi:hypothetical protein